MKKLKYGYDVYKTLNEYNNQFYNSFTASKELKKELLKKYYMDEKKNISFTFYQLCNTLTEDQKKDLKSKFNNIDFYKSQSEYAPEIKKDILMVCNHVIKEGIE